MSRSWTAPRLSSAAAQPVLEAAAATGPLAATSGPPRAPVALGRAAAAPRLPAWLVGVTAAALGWCVRMWRLSSSVRLKRMPQSVWRQADIRSLVCQRRWARRCDVFSYSFPQPAWWHTCIRRFAVAPPTTCPFAAGPPALAGPFSAGWLTQLGQSQLARPAYRRCDLLLAEPAGPAPAPARPPACCPPALAAPPTTVAGGAPAVLLAACCPLASAALRFAAADCRRAPGAACAWACPAGWPSACWPRTPFSWPVTLKPPPPRTVCGPSCWCRCCWCS